MPTDRAKIKAKEKKMKEYYKKMLIPFLAWEKDVYNGRNGSIIFYAYPYGRMTVWIGKNKINQRTPFKWISNADEFIVKKIIKSKEVMTFTEFSSGYQSSLRF